MKTLYEAANSLEAHMLAHLLGQEGIEAHIHGEHLQGGVGELPATGLVRLMVDEADYARARTVIERWDAQQPADGASRAGQAPPSARWPGVLLALLLGAGGTYAWFHVPASQDGVDYNRDGLLDEKWTFSASGRILKSEVDRNLDRKIDHVVHFNQRGEPDSAESDDDFDGRFETRSRYRLGNVVYVEVDTDGDGYPDLQTHFVHGVATRIEYMHPGTGRALRVEQLKLGIVQSAEVDTDRDGVLDTRVFYTPLGEVRGREPIAADVR